MIRSFLFYLSAFLCMLFLFADSGSILLGYNNLNFFSVSFSGTAFIFVTVFLFRYRTTFRNVSLRQLKEMQSKETYSWNSWISENISEFTILFLLTSPYVFGISSIFNAITFWYDKANVLTKVSVVVMVSFVTIMMLILLVFTYNGFVNLSRNIESRRRARFHKRRKRSEASL